MKMQLQNHAHHIPQSTRPLEWSVLSAAQGHGPPSGRREPPMEGNDRPSKFGGSSKPLLLLL